MDRHVLISVLSGDASPAETQEFEEWRNAHPENEAAFQRYAAIWSVIGRLDPPELTSEPEAERAVEGARAGQLPRRAAPSTSTSRPGRLSRPLLAAAFVIIGFGLGTLLSSRSSAPSFGPEEIASGAEAVTVSLTDGTTVRLAPESRLSVRREGPPRSVFLAGQGFFAVPSDQTEPFRVLVDGGELVVHGTRFAILAEDSGMQVVVVEGQVEIDAGGESLTVGRNEIGRAEDGGNVRVEPVEDVYDELDWMGDFVVFESTPLRDVATELNRRFALHVDIQDPDLSARTVTGSFQDQEPVQILTGICLAVDAVCTVEGDAVLVRPQPAVPSR